MLIKYRVICPINYDYIYKQKKYILKKIKTI